MKTLSELLKECSNLWEYNPEYCTCTNYALECNSSGFELCIVNDRDLWYYSSFKNRFGEFSEPENAVLSFLNYVKDNNINVNNLVSKGVRVSKMKEELDRLSK